ncbi:hypothetical protein [Paenibacillus thiaminolyticus]|nr:hypothetical protein [Paenibacillus thiaminolyticus]
MRESTNGLEEREYRAPFTAGVVVVVKVLIKKKNARLMMEEKIRQA